MLAIINKFMGCKSIDGVVDVSDVCQKHSTTSVAGVAASPVDEYNATLIELYASGLPEEVEAFIRTKNDEIHDVSARLNMDSTSVCVSVAISKIACEDVSTTVRLKRSLLVAFYEGKLKGTINHYGPVVNEHAASCVRGLIDLADIGILPCDGQERAIDGRYAQRAYVNASFASEESAADIYDALKRVKNASWMMYSEGTWSLRLSGCDGDSFTQVHAGPKDEGNTVSDGIIFGVTVCDDIQDGRIPDSDECYTHVYVDIDPYNLHMSCQHIGSTCKVYSFMMWDESWPKPQDASDQILLLEDRLMTAVRASRITFIK